MKVARLSVIENILNCAEFCADDFDCVRVRVNQYTFLTPKFQN